jgi:hypothetical protein
MQAQKYLMLTQQLSYKFDKNENYAIYSAFFFNYLKAYI